MSAIAVDLEQLAAFESDLGEREAQLRVVAAAVQADLVRVAAGGSGQAVAYLHDATAAIRKVTEEARYSPMGLGYLGRLRELIRAVAALRADLANATAAENNSLFEQLTAVAGVTLTSGVASAVSAVLPLRAAAWLATDVFGQVVVTGRAHRKGQRRAAPPEDLAGYLGFIPTQPETVTIVRGIDAQGQPAYVVCVRGMAMGTVGVNDHMNTLASVLGTHDPYSQAIADAMRQCIPAGANVMLIGHSQGGAAVANLASDPRIAGKKGRYHVSHVALIGAPAQGKAIQPGISVLRVENQLDAVPAMDGITRPAADTYRFSAAGANPHSATAYAAELGTGDFLTSRPYRAFAPGLDRYFSARPVEVTNYQLTARIRGVGIEY